MIRRHGAVKAYAAGDSNGWRLLGITGNNSVRYFNSSEYAGDATLRPGWSSPHSLVHRLDHDNTAQHHARTGSRSDQAAGIGPRVL
jgi:hypothetical protein